MILAVRSLRFRLLAGALVWIAGALVAAGAILVDLFQEHVQRRLEAELATHLDQLTAALEVAPDGRARLVQEPSDPRFRRPLSGLYWQVEAVGEPLRSRSLWDQALALPPDAIADGEVHRHRIPGPAEPRLILLERSVVLPGATAPWLLAVAADARLVAEPTAAFARTLALSLGVLGLALLAAGVVQVEVGLRPLARLRRELAAVRAGLRKRFATAAVPVEVEPLAEDLNLLLEHSEAVLARARVQAGNLAHALKADLAVLANEVRGLTPANVGEAAPRIEGRLERMRRHLDHHMARARAAAARGVPGVSTEVGAVADGLARTLGRLHAGRGLELVVAIPAGLRFGGEQEDLQEMLGNLMDNACKWARQRVHVTGRAEDRDTLVLAVEDDGPGLPPGRAEIVPAPGVRLDESVPGTGLGLAVVRDLAELYGGVLQLGAAKLGGLRAELRLPAARG